VFVASPDTAPLDLVAVHELPKFETAPDKNSFATETWKDDA
jgi:hypothetical protein